VETSSLNTLLPGKLVAKVSAASLFFSTAHLVSARPEFSSPHVRPPQPEYKSRVVNLFVLVGGSSALFGPLEAHDPISSFLRYIEICINNMDA